MKTNFTPGPWVVESDKTSVVMGNQVVIVAPAPDGSSRIEQIANASLIAAAPALYEALEACRRELGEFYKESGPCDHSVGICFCQTVMALDAARAALAAARGEA